MGEVIAFQRRQACCLAEDEPTDIDLVTAVDVAIRDLRDIEQGPSPIEVRELASECRRMLSTALERARC